MLKPRRDGNPSVRQSAENAPLRVVARGRVDRTSRSRTGRCLEESGGLSERSSKAYRCGGVGLHEKKRALAQPGAVRARTLSGLLLEGKCFRAGVELIRIDPAYKSTIGAVKYLWKRGCCGGRDRPPLAEVE